MTKRVVVHQTKKKKSNPWLPVIGIVLAVVFLVIAYVLAPEVVAYLRRSAPQLEVGTLANPTTEQLIFAGIIWAVLFGVGIFIVAILSGRDVDERQGIQVRKDMQKRQKERRQLKKRGKSSRGG
jgi:hypothetical protein